MSQSSKKSDFSDYVISLLGLKGQLDKKIQSFKEEAKSIRAYYKPRAEFERWKATEDGKLWKEKQHKRQQGHCGNPGCKTVIKVKGSHIDHIRPISKFPELAINVKNLRLLCPDCNTKKGSKY